ncbi:golgin subfamily A member 4-like isoform X3, partial [Biomphalaria pfeifferi]
GDEKNASTESIGRPVAESTPQKNGNQAEKVPNDSGSNVAIGQLVDIPLFDSTSYETASDMSSLRDDETPKVGRSRTSSISSMTSDSSFFPSVSFSHSYYMPSDVESEMEETSVNLSSVSKEDLYAFVKRFERRAFKYKSKFMELAVAYKDMIQEREKLKSTMAQCQDRAFRRMSELREQIQLDQLAKRDLEDNYRLLLEEKDEYVKVLNMQLKLLKEGKDIPEELQTKLVITQAKAEAPPPSSGGEPKAKISQNEEIELLKSKIKRQDGLLQKCKETITTYKEKVTQLSHDKQDLLGKLELSSKNGSQTNLHQSAEQLAKLQSQIQEAKKVIEQLESDREVAIASVKQQVHEEMEKRDAELENVKTQNHELLVENNNIKVEMEKLENEVDSLKKTNREQLDKAREIMKKLKEDKLHAIEQAEERLCLAEQNMEEEKEKMLSDLKRGKAEAFSVMQQESEKALQEKLSAALEERDRMWNEKVTALEKAHNEILLSKEQEKEIALNTMQAEVRQKLVEKEEEVKLAVEERELQKMAAVSGLDEQKDELLRRIEELVSEKIELTNKLSKFQEDTEQQILQLKSMLKKEMEDNEKKIETLNLQHQVALEEERVKLNQSFKEELEAASLDHANEMQTLKDRLEQSVQEFNKETETLYNSQVESLKSEKEQELSRIKTQLEETSQLLEEMKTVYSETKTKLIETEQLLESVQSELSSNAQENKSQVEELYAAINGRGEERLRQQLKDAQSELKLKQEEHDHLVLQVQEENNHFKKQVEAFQGESEMTAKLDGEKEELTQQLNTYKTKEAELSNQILNLEEKVTNLSSQREILCQELSAVREELTSTQVQLSLCHTDKVKLLEDYQMKVCELEKTNANSSVLREYEEKIKLLDGEHETLVKSADSREEKIQELEKLYDELLKNASSDRESLESKYTASENQVCQLQDVIRSLETCQNVVETEKCRLEEKLTSLENIVEDLKRSKEELNEKLYESHQTLMEKAEAEKQNLEITASELAAQITSMKNEIEELNKVLVSKSDEIIALRSVIDDNMSYSKSLEEKTEELTNELQKKTSSEGNLMKTLEKLKAEANAKVKGLKEMKDSLTDQLQLKVKELEEFTSASREDTLQLERSYEEKMSSLRSESKSLEDSFKVQFEQKQSKYKETLNKLKERYEEKLRDKDSQFEEQMRNLTSQKDLGMEDMHKSFEKLKEEQIANLQQNHELALSEMKSELDSRYQALVETHSQQIKVISDEHQNVVSQLQLKLDEYENQSKELQVQLDSSQSQLRDVQSQLEDLQEKYATEINVSTLCKNELELLNKNICDKQLEIEKLHNNLQFEAAAKETQILLLSEELQKKAAKLDSMAGTISAEHEYLQKQLNLKTEELEECSVQNANLKKQLEELQDKHRLEFEEKDMLIIETNQKLSQLQIENSSIEEMLKAINDKLQEKEEALRNLDQSLAATFSEKDSQINNLNSQIQQLHEDLNTTNSQLFQKEQDLSNIKEQSSLEIQELKKCYEEQLSSFTSKELEWQQKNDVMSEKLQDIQSQSQAKLLEMENQETSFKEQVNFLKQQLHKALASELSFNELQSNLQQKVAESEEKLFAQLQAHQQELQTVRQEAELSKKDLKQKYVVKLKEIQGQAKSTIEELETTLRLEKAAKDEIHSELTRANTRLLQLEENSGLSHDTIVDLEHKVKELNETLKLKDSELTKLATDRKETETSLQTALNEAQSNYQLTKESLIQAENTLKDKENELQRIIEQNTEQNDLLENNKNIIANLETTVGELEKEKIIRNKFELKLQEKTEIVSNLQSEIKDTSDKYRQLEVQLEEKTKHITDLGIEMSNQSEKCFQLESLLDKTNSLLHQAQNTCVELENKVQSANHEHSETEHLKSEQQQLLLKVSNLEEEKDKLLLQVHEVQSQCDKYKAEIESTRVELQQANSRKDDWELKFNDLQSSHSKELSEIISKMESQSSNKVAEYKKKAEAYISQVKKQLQDEKNASVSQLQDIISKLESDLTASKSEVSALQLASEKMVDIHNKELHEVKILLEEMTRSKEKLMEDLDKKKENYSDQETVLREKLKQVETEKYDLLARINSLEEAHKEVELLKSKEFTELQTEFSQLENQIESMRLEKEKDRAALERLMTEKLEEAEKKHLAALEEQAGEHSSKLKQLLKECNQQLTEKEREFEATIHEALEKSERGEQGLLKEHHADLEELRKELLERDERLQELHVEYKSKLESLNTERSQRIKELETEIMLLKQSNERNLTELEMELKTENQRNLQTRENIYQEEELIQQNQAALTAFQKGMSGNATSLQEQVISLTKQLEQLKQNHKLELAEAYSGIEMGQGSLPKPLVAAPNELVAGASHQEMSLELQELELQNMDLQAQVYHLNGELSQYKVKERDLMKKVEKMERVAKGLPDDDDPPLSLDGSYSNHDDSALFREPTEFEYLKNILYEYMMGKETKTLTKVIATVVRFSEEQTRNVLSKTESKLRWLPTS